MTTKNWDNMVVRTVTTDRIHCPIQGVYDFLEWAAEEKILPTHMLPNMAKAVQPWLRKVLPDPTYWQGGYDSSHVGSIDLPKPTNQEVQEIRARYRALSHPLDVEKARPSQTPPFLLP